MSIEIILSVLLYVVLGLGSWSTSKYKGGGKETPFVILSYISMWPVALLFYAMCYLFTGNKACDL